MPEQSQVSIRLDCDFKLQSEFKVNAEVGRRLRDGMGRQVTKDTQYGGQQTALSMNHGGPFLFSGFTV